MIFSEKMRFNWHGIWDAQSRKSSLFHIFILVSIIILVLAVAGIALGILTYYEKMLVSSNDWISLIYIKPKIDSMSKSTTLSADQMMYIKNIQTHTGWIRSISPYQTIGILGSDIKESVVNVYSLPINDPLLARLFGKSQEKEGVLWGSPFLETDSNKFGIILSLEFIRDKMQMYGKLPKEFLINFPGTACDPAMNRVSIPVRGIFRQPQNQGLTKMDVFMPEQMVALLQPGRWDPFWIYVVRDMNGKPLRMDFDVVLEFTVTPAKISADLFKTILTKEMTLEKLEKQIQQELSERRISTTFQLTSEQLQEIWNKALQSLPHALMQHIRDYAIPQTFVPSEYSSCLKSFLQDDGIRVEIKYPRNVEEFQKSIDGNVWQEDINFNMKRSPITITLALPKELQSLVEPTPLTFPIDWNIDLECTINITKHSMLSALRQRDMENDYKFVQPEDNANGNMHPKIEEAKIDNDYSPIYVGAIVFANAIENVDPLLEELNGYIGSLDVSYIPVLDSMGQKQNLDDEGLSPEQLQALQKVMANVNVVLSENVEVIVDSAIKAWSIFDTKKLVEYNITKEKDVIKVYSSKHHIVAKAPYIMPIRQFLQIRKLITYAIPATIGILVLFGMLIILLLGNQHINRKSREIGLLKGQGLTRFNIAQLYFMQSLLLNLISGIVALVISFVSYESINQIAINIFRLPDNYKPVVLTWSWVLTGVFLMVMLASLVAIFPAQKASKIQPADALRFGSNT